MPESNYPRLPRKIIQIAAVPRLFHDNEGDLYDVYVFALCSDGSLWTMAESDPDWTRLTDIPQGEES